MVRVICGIIAVLSSTCTTSGAPPNGRLAAATGQTLAGGQAPPKSVCGPKTLGSWPPRPIKEGVVKDAQRALALGSVYLVSIYGKNVISLPVSAALKNGVWTVEDDGPGYGGIGGARYVRICQSNGAVLETFETQ